METERMQEFIDFANDLFDESYPLVTAKTWKKWPVEKQIAFRTMLTTVVVNAETVRSEFDDAVWRGHDDGSVKRAVESVRTRTIHKSKPGRPAPTPEEIRAKALAKKGVVLPKAEVTEDETSEVITLDEV